MDFIVETFRDWFYPIDFAVGIAAPLIVYALYRAGRVEHLYWLLFFAGFAIGLTWEVPMQLANETGLFSPVHAYTREPPAHFSVIIIMHSSWDGGIFLLGAALARLVCGGPLFLRFRSCELGVMVVWGQVSALWVELTSTYGEAWHYIPKPWNPAMFHFNGSPITVLPQLIWLAAPVVFYFVGLFVSRMIDRKSAEEGIS